MEPLEAHLVGQSGRAPSFWHEIRALPILERLESNPVVVADIGAGAGPLGEIVMRESPSTRYRFYEPIDALAQRLESLHGPAARIADISEVSSADIVTALDVVEHVDDDHGFVADIAGPMRRGAFLVLTVPALPVLWSPWDERLGHYRRYTRPTLSATVRGLPLEVVEVAYLFPELLAPALVRRALGQRRADAAPGADFPELPVPLDRCLRAVGSGTYKLRRWWPFGTSLLLVARRR